MPGSSIQSYFSSSPARIGDGFTAEEKRSALQPGGPPTSAPWTPILDYEEVSIGTLSPGPRHLALMGRVVNFYNVAKPSKQHKAAQGYLKLQLADDTGVLTVRLWYADATYPVRLGQLVSVWTVHVSHSSEHNSLAPSSAPLFTSVFPEGERHCHVMLHLVSDDGTRFRRPYGCRDASGLAGLMTLKTFAEGGWDVEEGKVLVCVRSIGARKRYINKTGKTTDLVSLGIFDATADASLILYSSACDSAPIFVPSHTILLISSPGWRIDATAKLSLNAASRLDIDPDFPCARRLRSLASRLTKKEHVNPTFPAVDTSRFETASARALWRLAELDAFARANPREQLLGYVSVVLTGLDIVTPAKRNMLLSGECCGIAVFGNEVELSCKGCAKKVEVRVNSRILGPVIDETGQISSGKLVLSDQAWEQLLGRNKAQLVATSVDVLRYMEQRLLWLRVTMGFAVCLEDEIGRLAVWCIKN